MRLVPLLFLLSACSASMATPRDERAGFTSQTPPQEIHVHVDIPGGSFAAYQLVIKWDPAVARIRDIEPCRTKDFPGVPEFDPASFTTGRTKVFATAVRAGGYGEYHLLRVRFDRVSAGRTRVEVMIEALYDDSPVPRRITGILKELPREIRFD